MVRRRSTVRFRKGAPRGIHTSPGSMFTFGSDILVVELSLTLCPRFPGGWCRAVSGLPLCAGGCCGQRESAAWPRWRCWWFKRLLAWGWVRGAWLRRAGGRASELAAALAGAGLLAAGGGAAGVVLLPRIECVQGALVAHDYEAGEPEHERRDAHQADPAAVDAVDGGILDGGVEPLGGGASPVGDPPGLRGVVMFLPGCRRDLRAGGDGLLGAAGRRVLRRGEDLRAAAL